MIRVIQRRLIIPRGDTGIFTIPAMTQAEGAIGVFTIFDPITNTRIFQKQVEIEGENFNISFSHADTVNLKAGDYFWDIKFYKNPILADNKVIDGEEINSYYAAFQAPKCEIRETGDDFLMIEGQPAKIEDLNIILGATEAANAAKVAATEKAEEAAAKLEQMIAAIPTKVSELENDSGYLQQETDPTVPAWAKAQTKPSYTPQEVGALPADTFIPTVPTNVSAFTNDAGYLTTHQDISMKANSADLAAVATSGSYEDLSDKPIIPEVPVQDVQVNGTSVLENGVANVPVATSSTPGVVIPDSTSFDIFPNGLFRCAPAPDNNIKYGNSGVRFIPTSKQHQAVFYGLAKAAGHDERNSTEPLGTYTDGAKTAIQTMLDVPSNAAMTTAIGNAIGNINSFDMAVVQELPARDISTHTIYLVPKTGETNDVYDEYVYINDAWEMVGNTQIDLSNYVQFDDYATSDKAGVVKIRGDRGLIVSTSGLLRTNTAQSSEIKEGANAYKPITSYNQHTSTFYGLAKAAGDTTQSQSDNAVGTYTTEAKAAIRSMIGAAASADLTVQDVQVNGTSIVNNGTANIPLANDSSPGLIRANDNFGIGIKAGYAMINSATSEGIKSGGQASQPIVPIHQHESVFYGLAKASGDTTQSQSDNAVGTYTDEAKAAIQQMLDVPAKGDIPEVPVQDVQVAGTSIVGNDGVAAIPYAGNNIPGLFYSNTTSGFSFNTVDGIPMVQIKGATPNQMQAGSESRRAIVPAFQHYAIFYGLSKVAGVDLANETVTLGTYPEASKTAIKEMLGVEEGLKVVRLI